MQDTENRENNSAQTEPSAKQQNSANKANAENSATSATSANSVKKTTTEKNQASKQADKINKTDKAEKTEKAEKTDKNDKTQKSANKAEQSKSQQKADSKYLKYLYPKNRISKLAVLNFILIIFILCVAGYFFYSLKTSGNLDFLTLSQTNSENRMALIDDLQQNIAKQDAEITQLSTELDLANEKLLKLQNSDTRQNSALADMLNSIEDQQKVQSEDWRLAEAEYLLRLASQELILAQDAKSALRLMQAAYTKLDDLSLAASLPILKALQTDISNLAVLQNSSTKNISIELLALSQVVSEINETRDFKLAQISENNSENNAGENSAQAGQAPDNSEQKTSMSARFWQSLKGLVIIKQHTKPASPLLSQEALIIEKQRILLLLNQASWASLRKDTNLYQKSIAESLAILENTFATNAQAQQVIQKLKNLQKVKLEIAAEKYTKGLQKLEEFLLARYQLPMAKQAQESKSAKSTQVTKSEKVEKTDKAQKTQKADKANKAEKTDKQEKADKQKTDKQENPKTPAESQFEFKGV